MLGDCTQILYEHLKNKISKHFKSLQYHGVSAFSESEAVAIRDSLAANHGFVKAFVSVHSYGGIWMSPYGYLTELPLEYDEMVSTVKILKTIPLKFQMNLMYLT